MSDKLTLDEIAEDFFVIYIERGRNGASPRIRSLEKKTYVEQEIGAIMQHAGKPKKRALEAVKTQSLQNVVLHKFHNLNNAKCHSLSDH